MSVYNDITHSFSGSDIRPYFLFRDEASATNIVDRFAHVQQISISVHSDIGLTRQIGNRFASSVVDGPVTIAGSIVFTLLGESPLLPLARAYRNGLIKKRYTTRLSSIPPFEVPLTNHLPPFDIILFFNNEYKEGEYVEVQPRSDVVREPIEETNSQSTISTSFKNQLQPVVSSYKLPIASNSIAIIRNIRFPDTAYNFSIDDMMTELVTQYIATDFMEPTSFKEYTKTHFNAYYNDKLNEIKGNYDSPSPFNLPTYKGDIQKILNLSSYNK